MNVGNHRRRIASRFRLTTAGSVAFLGAILFSSVTPRAGAGYELPATRHQLAYADGAPPGFSGGFKEQSCHACHFEAEINTPPGQVTIVGVPDRFIPAEQYPLTVTLSRQGMALGGFQLAARFEDGTQAGTFEPGAGEAERIKVETQENVQYVGQRRPGADPIAPGTAVWTVIWTAPAAGASITFNVSANAADNDDSVRGDYIYTATFSSSPQ